MRPASVCAWGREAAARYRGRAGSRAPATMSIASSHTVLAWRDGALRALDAAPAGALLAADSWLVDDGARARL